MAIKQASFEFPSAEQARHFAVLVGRQFALFRDGVRVTVIDARQPTRIEDIESLALHFAGMRIN